jgi:hypothetical protein
MLMACCFAVLAGAGPLDARASETDQFTLPPQPLDDLGLDLAAIVRGILHAEIAELNARGFELARNPPDGDLGPAEEREFVKHVYQQTGIGFPETTIERAIHYGDFAGRNVRFMPDLNDSIYAGAFSPVPLIHLFDVPTIRLYGVDLGSDKLGHIFEHGYQYFTEYTGARDRGMGEADAIAVAVQYGVLQERTVYGAMTTGVYSNGDLAGNYAGFEFYRNLFHEVRIGDRTLPPIVSRDGARWIVDPERDNAELLKPFISEHLNEAYNPSLYFFSVDLIRSHVRDRCASWFRQVPDFDEITYRAHLKEAKTWFGEPYGWDLPDDRAVSLLECFRFDTQSQPRDPSSPGRNLASTNCGNCSPENRLRSRTRTSVR